jgi:glycosyltransferase involved in cell wall biosynthesis
MKVSIILPTRNEELLIKNTVLDIAKFLHKRKILDYELILIINGTIDNSKTIIQDLARNNNKIKIFNSPPGYGRALRKGLKEAKGKYIVIYNVDFYDLKMIDLINIDLYGKYFIIGSKMAHWSEDNRKTSRRIISYLFNKYLRIVHNFRGSDTHGIKVLKNEVVAEVLPTCKTSSGIFDTEFVLRAQYRGYKFADFPVTVVEKRPPRFTQRLLQTPKDIIDLYIALNDKKN